MRVALIFTLTFVGAAARAQAQSVNLAWDAPRDFAVAGYLLHVGLQPGVYGQSIDVGTPTTYTYTFTQPQPGVRHYFAVSAYNAGNEQTPRSNEIFWKLNIPVALTQPTNQISVAGTAVSLQLSVTDDGDPLTFTATNLPSGLSINASTGRITGSPTTAGSRTVTVSVSDGQSSASRTFTWQINTVFALAGLTPSLSSPRPTGTAITFTASGAGGVAPYQYKFWLYNGSTWAVVRDWSTTATYTWTPTAPNASYRVGVWARDATVTTDSSTYNVSMPFVVTGTTTAPLSISSLLSNLGSPRTAGTAITFTTTAAGGMAPYQYKWWLFDGYSWTIARNWDPSNTFTWTPTQAGSNYRIGVWVRNAGVTADVSDVNVSMSYVITPSGPLTPLVITGLNGNVASPQVAGTSITFTAAASGGQAPYQYKWWVSNGASWTMVSDWSASATYTWSPTTANSNYRIGVWVRNATTTSDVSDANVSIPYPITAPVMGTPLTLTLASSVLSPQTTGTAVTFTAAVSGGTAPYQYKWWLYNGVSWTIVQDWNGSSSYTWTPLQANANYRIGVWVRNATTTSDTNDANLSVSYVILAPGSATPLRISALASSLPSPQRVGIPVTFTAVAAGGSGSYHYKWWLFDGTSWTVQRAWSTSSTLTWTPTTPNPLYRIGVWVRPSSSTADSSDVNLSMPFAVVP